MATSCFLTNQITSVQSLVSHPPVLNRFTQQESKKANENATSHLCRSFQQQTHPLLLTEFTTSTKYSLLKL